MTAWDEAFKAAADLKVGQSPAQPIDADAEKKPPKSAATVLVEMAQSLYTFAADGAGEPFGVPRSGPKVVQMLRGGKTSLRNQLSRAYFRHTGKAAPQQALADALLVLEGIAQDADPQDLHLRVARHDAALWLDLGDPTGRAVRITGDGWTVEPRAPVLFKRTALTAALPEPVRGGSLDELWRWLNVEDEDRPLVLGWLIAILHPDIPHPILSIGGEQGSGKSTAEKVLVSLIDPSPVPLRKPPRDTESWVTAASGSWVVGIDNLSLVPDWLSDAFCRAVTGDGDVRRRLYTDGGMHVFAFRRCLILNGIDIGAVRGDLADRLLSISFRNIPEQDRLTETEIWPKWDAAHPRLLGALLCEAARNAGVLPSVRLGRKPRMADFANVLAAVDEVNGTAGLARYLHKQNETAADSLTADAFIAAVAALGSFTGTSADLLERVSTPEKLPKGWPANARTVTQLLKRQAPVMRRAGWTVSNDDGRNHSNVAIWTIIPPEKARNSSSQSSHASHGREDARHARQEYGPSQDDGTDTCDHCGDPGADTTGTDGTITARLHRGCYDAWFAATEPDERTVTASRNDNAHGRATLNEHQ